MKFKFCKIDTLVFQEIFQTAFSSNLKNLIYRPENWTPSISRLSWVVNENEEAALIKVSLADRANASLSYVYVKKNAWALFRSVSYLKFELLAMDPKFQSRIEELKSDLVDALRVGGLYLNGVTDPANEEAVPSAVFNNF